MRHFVSLKNLVGVVAVSVMSAALMTPAAQATTGDAGITVRDGICDYAAAGLGHGTASDPFIINTPKQLAEANDCSTVQVAITGASGNGTLETFTAINSFGSGQTLMIGEINPGGYDSSALVKVVSATPTQFTVAGAESGAFVSGGTAYASHHFYKLNADLNLSSGTESWNDTRSANITAVSSDGSSVTVTANNTFTSGQTVNIRGINPWTDADRVGDVTITSATSTQFTFASSRTGLSVSNAVAYAPGWTPIGNNSNFQGTFDGNGHTITGLTIHSNSDYIGLFGSTDHSSFSNLNLVGAVVDQSGYNHRYYAAALVGYSVYTNFLNISVTGSLTSAGGSAGLVSGDQQYGNAKNISAAGSIYVHTGVADQGSYLGGAFGYSTDASIVDATSSVVIDGTNQVADLTQSPGYAYNVGGLVGGLYEFGLLSNAHATGNISGGLSSIGGLVGDSYEGDIHNATATGNISLVTPANYNDGRYFQSVGGLMGYFYYGTVFDSSATGSVTFDQRLHHDGNAPRARYVGGLLGSFDGDGGVVRSHSSGDVTVQGSFADTYKIGGLVGEFSCCGNLSHSYSTGNVAVTNSGNGETSEIGGFVGEYSCCGSIDASHSTGSVVVDTSGGDSQPRNIGGFVGYFDCCGGVSTSYSTGDLTVTSSSSNAGMSIGGFVGQSRSGDGFESSYTTGNVAVVNAQFVGGFAGWVDRGNAFQSSYATGSVTATFDGDIYVGGFVGYSDGQMSIDRSYSTGAVNASPATQGQSASVVGGLVGYASSPIQITDSFARGNVSGSTRVGGLIGFVPETGAQVVNTYSAGSVTATGTGAIKDAVATGAWSDSSGTDVYNSTTAGVSTSTNVLAKSTSDMKAKATFTALGWKFGSTDPWRIAPSVNGGYPYVVAPVASKSSGSSAATAATKSLGSVYFGNNSSKLTAAGKKALAKIAVTIKKKKYRTVLVVGYAASGGKSDSQVLSQYKLSWNRAQVTANYIAALLKHMKAKKVAFKLAGAGAHNPVATNKTAKGRALNRRAEITGLG